MPLAYRVKRGFELGKVDLARRLDDEESYQRELRKLQVAMLQLQQIFRVERRRGIIVLEGWDAAGKDGAIRRMTEKLDLRWLRVCPIGKPSPEEQGRHFLWRFWQLLPPPGHLAIFDRSWYGRVLVERVEGYARQEEWRRGYDEINGFEKLLVDDGVRLVKLFLHISPAEQLRRLAERIATPTKRWKINAEDFRNRARHADYLRAVDDMFARTSTGVARWHVVPGEYKWFARIAVLKTAVEALADGIELKPPPLDPEIAKAAARLLPRHEFAALGLPEK
ncbi:MAG TPA: polyphosphate kinase [Stellaceae bacterium]|nr:polyphosphate kinase [Stellaceae bacterium]